MCCCTLFHQIYIKDKMRSLSDGFPNTISILIFHVDLLQHNDPTRGLSFPICSRIFALFLLLRRRRHSRWCSWLKSLLPGGIVLLCSRIESARCLISRDYGQNGHYARRRWWWCVYFVFFRPAPLFARFLNWDSYCDLRLSGKCDGDKLDFSR